MIAALVGVAFVAGFVDAIAGGGGLLTLPALLAAGLPPHVALGTNKGQAVFGSGAALVSFTRAGWVDRKTAPGRFAVGFAGSLAGAALVSTMSPATLRPVVLALLVGVGVALALRPPLEPVDRGRPAGWGLAIAAVVGAYDGFFGPGTGTFLIVGQVWLLGYALVRASAEAKVVNFASNLAAMALFAAHGTVDWSLALPMAGAQLAGAFAGSHVAVRGGDRLVRWVVLGVVTALVVKLGWDASR
ncbi:MAG: TSUP family transporter [Myxococcota bacterium]